MSGSRLVKWVHVITLGVPSTLRIVPLSVLCDLVDIASLYTLSNHVFSLFVIPDESPRVRWSLFWLADKSHISSRVHQVLGATVPTQKRLNIGWSLCSRCLWLLRYAICSLRPSESVFCVFESICKLMLFLKLLLVLLSTSVTACAHFVCE